MKIIKIKEDITSEIANSFKVDSIDNVGAGDNFLAALIDELFIKKNNLKSSLRITLNTLEKILLMKQGQYITTQKRKIKQFMGKLQEKK